MVDEILKELWEAKDSIAKDYGNDLDALAAFLKTGKVAGNRKVINLRAIKKMTEGAALDGNSAALHPRQ